MKLSDLCTKYPTAYGRVYFECGEGWYDLLDELGAVLELANTEAVQVKSKFGGLRCYVGDAPDDVYEAIDAAEAKAWKTCETCGDPGQRRGGGWIQTLCDGCAEGRE